MKILILGHTGMLGNAVEKYLNSQNHEIETISSLLRWNDSDFKKAIINSKAEFIINCIGAIHQRDYDDDYYEFLNVKLPNFLDVVGKKIIYPSTDCVFSGNLKYPEKYLKTDNRDANDLYGKSKAKIDRMICNIHSNTKIIRTSIIGHELQEHVSLLDWFLNSIEDELNGYVNYYWNGITTLQWAKISERIINNWDEYPILNQVGSEVITKADLLRLIGKVYEKTTMVNDYEVEIPINKTLYSDIEVPSLEKQLIELKEFYRK